MRSNAVFWSWIGELLAGFAVALVTAFVIGRAILFGIYAAVIQHFPKIDMKSGHLPTCYQLGITFFT
jgi:hypothetical protein